MQKNRKYKSGSNLLCFYTFKYKIIACQLKKKTNKIRQIVSANQEKPELTMNVFHMLAYYHKHTVLQFDSHIHVFLLPSALCRAVLDQSAAEISPKILP